MSNEELPFALMRWIKAQQDKAEAHRVQVIKENQENDKLYYMQILKDLLPKWKILSPRDKLFIQDLVKWHESSRNFTHGQKSAITTLYLKFSPKKSA